jgi:hypothetical protein
VEPAVLQNLPDNALLLVTRNPGSPLQAVEIITLPGVATTPLSARDTEPVHRRFDGQLGLGESGDYPVAAREDRIQLPRNYRL